MEFSEMEPFSTTHIGHLGLVADKIDSMDLIQLIDKRLPLDETRGVKVTHGERVAAMILNGLGFIDSRLYLFPEFLSDKPVHRLFNGPLEANWFNDDALGRCLDEIAAYGTTKLFTELSLLIGERRGLLGRSMHIDTTTLSLYGEYEEGVELAESTEKPTLEKPRPERGYAKSGRHDLKQMVLLLATTGASSFPLWMESHSGNASDQTTLATAATKIQALCRGLRDSADFIYVGDSAIYSNILKHSEDLYWITRVPERVKEAREWALMPKAALEWQSLENGYEYSVKRSMHGGVEQRWMLFYSEAAFQREIKTLDKKISQASTLQEKAWWHLSNQVFSCEKDAKTAVEKQKKSLVYHTVTTEIVAIKKHAGKGRPKADALPSIAGYQIHYTLSLSEEKIAPLRECKGRFILASNQLNEDRLPNPAVLTEYKAQSGTERGFKFIKDDTFQVDSVFLKTPERIEVRPRSW